MEEANVHDSGKEVNILELLEDMKKDETWCQDEDKRAALVNKMIYFIIEN